MLKLADNPAPLYPLATALADVAGPWWVAHTKARCEKSFAHALAARDISYYLPMQQQVTISGGRRRIGMIPLFPSYVFFAGDFDVRQKAIATNRLCRVIEVFDQRRLIAELSATNRVLEAKLHLDPYPFAVAGSRVRVASGPLEGIEGIVLRREDHIHRLILQVTMLGQATAVDIEADRLDPITELRAVAS
jgi:transcription antitermination factor NusG